jgi:hypothetical protein
VGVDDGGGLGLVEEVLTSSLCFWSDTELIDRLDTLHTLTARITAAQLAVLAEIDSRGLPRTQGAANTTAWLRDRLRITGSTAGRYTRLATTAATHPTTATALADGRINPEHLAIIGDTLTHTPTSHHTEAETSLIELAATHGPRELRILGHRILTHLNPTETDRRESEQLARQEATAHQRRYLTLTDIPGTAMVRVRGQLSREDAAIIRAAIDALLSPRVPDFPRRTNRPGGTTHPADVDLAGTGPTDRTGDVGSPRTDRAGESPAGCSSGDVTTAGRDTGHAGAGSVDAGSVGAGGVGAGSFRTGDDSPVERPTPGQQRADAFTQLCGILLASGQLPDNGGDRPQLTVTIDLRTLQDQIGTASLDTGETISPTAARRLACDAAIIPAVLNGPSQVLDIGRERRLFTGPLRRALVLRDRGCAFPTCDRPPRWTEAHHIQSWADGGPTNLTNGVLLCRHHHRLLHHHTSDTADTWQVQINPNDGLPEFTPPAYIDPQQRPRRNQYHRRE